MSELLKKYFKGDTILWIVFIMLCGISIIEMYSASSTLAYKASSHTAPMMRHAGFLFFGALLAFGIHLIPYKYIRLLSYIGLAASVFFLVWVQFKGQTINESARWMSLFGFQFQPSELAKLSVIIVVADLISRIKNPEDEKKLFRYIIIIAGLICGLILPENFSTAALLFVVVYTMMFIGEISWKRMLAIAGIIVAVVSLAVAVVVLVPENKMPDAFDRAYTWKARIERFASGKGGDAQQYVINDENRQMMHGKMAIARGSVTGVFPGNSIERDYLPQAYSDFIYSIIVEEIGLIGGIVVIFLYLILLFRAGMTATKCESVFPALLVIGLSLMIVLQAFISMSVATSLGPVTGQPLPLISRGGTSVIITCLYFGIILGVTRQLKNEQTNDNASANTGNDIPTIKLEDV
ncbi:MAG: FtsW/RodA/SpoVE family cell cycle protein [Prevotellaceae bacterium]|jgi:cell division protein FtsW|nr:FtsW/RodA/SpoVE family cell cycle protein [Prevotellaceae bacterium]